MTMSPGLQFAAPPTFVPEPNVENVTM